MLNITPCTRAVVIFLPFGGKVNNIPGVKRKNKRAE
jgi:hypothetical protein